MQIQLTRYAREGVAIAFWLYLLMKLFVFDMDVYLFELAMPELAWVLQYKLVAIMVVLAVLWIAMGHRAFFLFIGYVLVYPGSLLLRFPKHALPRWPLFLLFSPVLYTAAQNARSTFAIYTLAIVSTLLISAQSNSHLLIAAMLGLAIFLAVHLFRSLRKAYSTRVFHELANIAREMRTAVGMGQIEGMVEATGTPKSNTTASATGANGRLMRLYAYHAFADIVAEKIHDLIRRRIFDLYLIASWLYTVAITILVYGLEFWALHRLSPASFKNADGAGFWEFAGFSFSILTTTSLSHIEPSSGISTVASYSEVASGVIILVILVFSILTAAREAFREDAQEFTSELRETASAVEKRVSEVYELTLVQLEVALLRENSAFVNMLRKARGLPEFPAPKEPITSAQTTSTDSNDPPADHQS